MLKKSITTIYLYIFLCLINICSAEPININSNWQICPTDTFIENVNLESLSCQSIEIPSVWENALGDYDGFAVLHTRFFVPRNFKENQLGFYTERIRDADKVFINGQLIGETGEFPPIFEKAVFYSRLYSIPINAIDFEGENELVVWIFNDARNGGILNKAPQIGEFKEFHQAFHINNYVILAFIVVLWVFSFIHIINYIFDRKSKDSLYFGFFLLAWSAYFYTSSNLVLVMGHNLNFIFRLNVLLFFTNFILFLLFIHSFFEQQLSTFSKWIIGANLVCLAISLFFPQPKHLYVPVKFIEILALPVLIYLILLIKEMINYKVPYAKNMAWVIGLFMAFSSLEIFLDLFYVNEASSYSPIGPWVLILLSMVITLIVGHKNMSNYQKATFDSLTNALRLDCFVERCERLISRAERDQRTLVMMMIDIDNFKNINDEHGHIIGDNVLKLVSQVMQANLRNYDLVGRYGGDEFCVAAMVTSESEARRLVTRIHSHLNFDTLLLQPEVTIRLHSTIGATLYNPKRPSLSPGVLINRADNLLVKGKSNSKGRIIWKV